MLALLLLAALAVAAERRGVISNGSMRLVVALELVGAAVLYLSANAGWVLRQLLPPFLG